MSDLLISILKNGALAFLFSKLTKALNQKEISEIIAGSGWAIISIDTIKFIYPLTKELADTAKKTAETVGQIKGAFEGILAVIEKLASFVGIN